MYAGTGWPGMKVIWRLSPAYAGPVLLRGARIDGPGELRFDHYLGAVGGDDGGWQKRHRLPRPRLRHVRRRPPCSAPTRAPSG